MQARRIHILPESVANQIAAGEVVERPASVVKELIENSLDAAATRIEIEIQNGGKTEIRAADDGCGMIREDALLALDRHATSKIRSEADLYAIRTLGFRGEALPSIAAVSVLELETAVAGEPTGTRVRVHAGRVMSVEEMARQPGSTVVVRNLFLNVPARAKFLKSAAAESRATSDVVVNLALSRPAVAFCFRSGGRPVLDLRRAPDLATRIADIWGEDLVDSLIPLDRRVGRVRVAGLVQRPAGARAGLRRVYLFVNGRPFADRFVVAAAEDAYRTAIPAGHRPALFLYLELPVSDVDVNVHPAKAEVRFRDRGAVEFAVREAVREALGSLEAAASVGACSPPRWVPQILGPGAPAAEESEEPGTDARNAAPSQMALFVAARPTESKAEPGRGERAAAEWPPESRPKLWQVLDTYILAEMGSGLVVVDQHSAHERILFEQLLGDFQASGATSQRLLFPITVRLSPAEYSLVEELADLFRRAGFEVEPFGSGTVILHGVPNPHPYFDAERCFREMVAELTGGSPLVDSAANQHERIAKSFACKAAIKAGQRLADGEIAELWDRLFQTRLPTEDVHGRRTILRLSGEELARRLGRA